jgi:hypothetical protein
MPVDCVDVDEEMDEVAPQVSELQQSLRQSFRKIPDAVALHISVKAALRDHPGPAEVAIKAELQQMIDMKVWTPVYKSSLTPDARRAIIRSNMFCTEKFLVSGIFERMKARLVAGGHMQDKTLYTGLSASTVSTSVVFLVAALAAKENRYVVTVDIKGAYLNAQMKYDGVVVHMHIAKTLLDMLVKLDKSYLKYVCPDGGCIVRLDKALYGCVESASLWFDDVTTTLEDYGHVSNKRDVCCFNKIHSDKVPLTTIIHVDDLMITSKSMSHIDK